MSVVHLSPCECYVRTEVFNPNLLLNVSVEERNRMKVKSLDFSLLKRSCTEIHHNHTLVEFDRFPVMSVLIFTTISALKLLNYFLNVLSPTKLKINRPPSCHVASL